MTTTELLYKALKFPNIDKHLALERHKRLKKRLSNINLKLQDKETEILLKQKKSLLLAIELEQKPTKRIDSNICFFCGIHKGDLRAKDFISSGFTNHDLAKNPNSRTICIYCAVAIKTLALRQSNWLCMTSKIRYFQRNEIEEILFIKKTLPFIVYVTTSWKKLGQLKAPINYEETKFIIQYEEIQIEVFPKQIKPVYEILTKFYSIPVTEAKKKTPMSFFTKEMMSTGNYNFNRVREFGRYNWWKDEQVLQLWRGKPIFELLIYALNAKELRISKVTEKEITKNDTKGKRNQSSEQQAYNNKGRKGNDGQRLSLSSMEVDKLGQCKWF